MKRVVDFLMVVFAAVWIAVSIGWVVVLFVMCLTGCTDHEAEWYAFRTEHKCSVIDRTPGRTSYTTMVTGKGVQMLPVSEYGITTYRCDTGVVSRREQ